MTFPENKTQEIKTIEAIWDDDKLTTFKDVPKAALTLAGGRVEFGSNGETAKTAPVRMLARTGQPIEHWYFGRVVHDMAGMMPTKSSIPIDFSHEQVIGFLNKFDVSDPKAGLWVSGAIKQNPA